MQVRTQSNLRETDSLTREIENHARPLRKARGVKVGYFAKEATTAAITEFGRENAPARPFMREAAHASGPTVTKAMREYSDNLDVAVKQVGQIVKAAIKERDQGGGSAVLAEPKGNAEGALRDSAELERSVKVKIAQ